MAQNRTLESDWDYQPKIGSELGHHVKRESESRILSDFISRRNEGSMLICGQRGSGKTSTVFKAINEATSSNSKIIPVLIKATSIYATNEQDEKKNVLQSFIRSLNSQVKDNSDVDKDLKKNTSKFYNRAIASKVKSESKSEDRTSRVKTSRIHLNLISALSIIVIGIFVAIGTTSDYAWILSDYSWMISMVVFLSAGWLIFDYSKVIIKSSYTSASNYYLYDYDFSTMQSEFESLLENFAEKNFKILFILDELDKVGAPSLEIIINLKMLINQGNGLFIFISSPEILPNIHNKAEPNSTLFSQILFLKRPLFDEMKIFLDEIIVSDEETTKSDEGKEHKEDEQEDSDEQSTETQTYQNFKNYLCYQAKSGFYDLYTVIRDNIIGNDQKGLAILDMDLNDEKITKSNLQQVIEYVYERKKFVEPSKWQKNDQILETLYTVCESLENSPKLSKIVLEKNIFKIPVNPFSSSDPKLFSTVKDLFSTLTSQGYLQETPENTFQIIGKLLTFDKTKGGIFYEEQQKFVEEYRKMLELAINMANLHNKYLTNLAEVFSLEDIHGKWNPFIGNVNSYFNLSTLDDHRSVYFDLIGNDPSVYPSEKLQKLTIEIQNGYLGVKKGFLGLFTQIFQQKINGITGNQTLGDISRGQIRGSGVENTTFSHSELTFNGTQSHKLDHIVITENIPVDFLEKLLKATNQNILIISYGDSEDSSKYEDTSNTLSIDTIQQSLDELNKLEKGSKKYIFLSITLPIQSSDLETLLHIL